MEQWADTENSGEKEKGLATAWERVVEAVELELIGVTDKFRGGALDIKYTGGASGPSYGRTQLLPHRIVGQHGETDAHQVYGAEKLGREAGRGRRRLACVGKERQGRS